MPLNAGEQFVPPKGLEQIVVRREDAGLNSQTISGYHKCFDARSDCPIGDNEAASIRQVDIADGEIESLGAEERDRARNSLRSRDLITIIEEDVLQQRAHVEIVFH